MNAPGGSEKGLAAFLAANQAVLTRFACHHDPPASFFQTHSGVLQDRFVTMWPLIENIETFEEATRLASRELLRICAREGAQVVVGSTMTVRHLFEGMRPRVAEGLRLEYLGNYPLLPLRAEHLISLKGRRAVIFTDVVSSGRLIEDTVSFLAGHDVQVAAVVALVRLVHRPSESRIVAQQDRLEFRAGALCLPFIAFLDVGVETRGPEDIGTVTAIQMDPTTLLPKAQTELRADPLSAPMLSLEEEALAISADRELRLGYYRTGNDRFTSYLNIDSIARRSIGSIRAIISEKIDRAAAAGQPEPVLISTPSKENRDLLRAVLGPPSGHALTLDYVLFSKVDEFEGSSAYFLLSKHESVRGRPAIVLLSSIQSTETVRWLSAILSLNGCPSVTIICVVNRTSAASASFLARVLRLRVNGQEGVGETVDDDAADSHFELISILRLWDLSTPDLANMEALVHAQFRRFWDKCGSEVLTSLSRTDLRYFQPRDVYELAPVRDPAASRPLTKDGFSEDVLVCLAAKSLIVDRDPAPLIELINHPDLGKNALFAVYRYLLADPATLGAAPVRRHLSKVFAQSLRVADSRIQGSLAQRSWIEDGTAREEILAAIGKERNLLVGVALFSQFITGSERHGRTRRGVNPVAHRVAALLDRFTSDPLGFPTLSRLNDIDWGYALTFAAQMLEPLADPDEDRDGPLEALEHVLDAVSRAARGEEILHENISLIGRLAPPGSEVAQDQSVAMSLIAALSGMMDALKPDERISTGQCIASVREELLLARPRHSFCFFTLVESPRALEELFEDKIGDRPELDFRDTSEELRFLMELHGLIYAAALLGRLAWQARRVIRDAHVSEDWASYFLDDNSESLTGNLRVLTEVAQLIRSRSAVIRSEIDEIAHICGRIVLNLWGSRMGERDRQDWSEPSPFFEFIAGFECDLRSLLDKAVDAGCARIADQMKVDRERIRVDVSWPTDPDRTDIHVLCDEGVLLMALENLVSNFRHSDTFRQMMSGDAAGPVIGHISVEWDGLPRNPFITFRSEGRRPAETPRRISTIQDHTRRLRDFECEIFDDSDDKDFVISIAPLAIVEPRSHIP